LIIFEGKRTKYTNDAFLLRFKSQIERSEVKEEHTENKEEIIQRLMCRSRRKLSKEKLLKSSYIYEKFLFDTNLIAHSFDEILEQGKDSVKGKKFCVIEGGEKTYMELSFSSYIFEEKTFNMIQLKDITANIYCDQKTAENKLLEQINAALSHELRNPLNCLVAQNMQKDLLYDELENQVLVKGVSKDDGHAIKKTRTLF
jgi:nitrogen-specific signal transduction histidine kinase